MSRVTKLDVSTAPDEIKPVFEDMMRVRGNVPNMFRAMAHRPDVLRTMAAHFKAVMAATTLSVRLKELVVLRVSQMNTCDY